MSSPIVLPAPSSALVSKPHPLTHHWVLWGHLPQNTDWSLGSYVKIHTFSTLEETVAVTETLHPELLRNCMFFIMKEGITPRWEDDRNRSGGMFSYKVANKFVPDVWKQLTYALVGGVISSDPAFVRIVNGITISPKRNFCIVKIWTSTCQEQDPNVVTTEIPNLVAKCCLFKQHV